MWSRKPIPVLMSAWPEPSRLSTTSTRVSRVSRRMWAVRGDIGTYGIVSPGMVIKASLLRRVEVWPIVAALGAVLPLFAAEIWSGFRIAQSDPVLSVIAATEQPLSVRSPGGVWAMLLALTWFALAYWQRRMTLWEAALVIGGGAAVLARMGNAWVFGVAMFLPLARQLSTFSPGGRPVPHPERTAALRSPSVLSRGGILTRERILAC